MKKILHLISGGDTGGAKTHIMSLLGEMKNRIDITLGVFFEDVFIDEAKSIDIPTIVFKQNNRYDLSVINKIVEYINNKGINIVHCHGARANFIAFFLMRKLKNVKFVSTVHSDPRLDFKGNFYKQIIFKNLNTFALKKFENYIAISDDFKNMLIERGFSNKNIDVVYNGIDLNKKDNFVSKNEFLSRYNIPIEGLKIGILARLEEVKDHETFLRSATEFLKHKQAHFLIGGSGSQVDNLKKLSHELGINKNVFFLGEIKDSYSFINAIDINVLSSLSESFPYVILEGAKYKKPMVSTNVGGISKVVVDDISGYLFEVRDYKMLSKQLLKLSDNEELLKKFGENIYKIVEENYSSKSMADKHIMIYDKILYNKNVVLSGFYGFDNQGDDAILEAIVNEFKDLNNLVRIKVLSNNPSKTRRVYDVDASYRFNPFKVISTIKKSDMLISGGGSLLQDITSSRSLWYYLFVIGVAKFLNKKTVIYSNGVGPIKKKFNRWLTKKVLNGVNLITLRDKDSADYLSEIGIEKSKCLVRSDPVFLLKYNKEEAEIILNKICLDDNFIVLNLRPWTNDDKLLREVSDSLKKIMDDGHKVLLLPMHMSKDIEILKKLIEICNHENLYCYFDDMNVTTLMGIFAMAEMVIAMRLHGVIYSAAVHTKPFAISYDPKVTSFMKSIDSKYILDVNNLKSNDFYDMVIKCLNDDEYLDNILDNDKNRKELARLNAIEVLSLLEENCEKD